MWLQKLLSKKQEYEESKPLLELPELRRGEPLDPVEMLNSTRVTAEASMHRPGADE
jgi:hypothetical protein